MEYESFNLFSSLKNVAVFVTQGGENDSSFGSFNLAFHVEDSKKNVKRNRKVLEDSFKKRLLIPSQIHSNRVQVVDRDSINTIYECDSLVTNDREIIIGVLVADCVPIVLYDLNSQVIAVVHAGWRGSVGNICKNTINVMKENFACKPKDILVGIGPAILGECYEVGVDVYKHFQEALPKEFDSFCSIKDNKGYLDLQLVNKILLEKEGVLAKNIEIKRVCTHCNTDKYYSYRKSGKTGRFGIFASLGGKENPKDSGFS